MIVDDAPANLDVHWTSSGGDTGKRRVEHRSLLLLSIIHPEMQETGNRHA